MLHFAGHIIVPESVRDPLKYYHNNVSVSCALIDACVDEGVQRFVFSCSAAVYGIPREVPIREDAPLSPISPYGRSKLMVEWMLQDAVRRVADTPFSYVALRYFNVAGARSDGRLGQATREATHLIKVACEAACGKRRSVPIYGTDYATADGTCIGSPLQVHSTNRRPGDPPSLVANAGLLERTCAWRPRYDRLEIICEAAYRWEQHQGAGHPGSRTAPPVAQEAALDAPAVGTVR